MFGSLEQPKLKMKMVNLPFLLLTNAVWMSTEYFLFVAIQCLPRHRPLPIKTITIHWWCCRFLFWLVQIH